MTTPGEQRALDWQTSRRKRREFKRSLQTKLKGSQSSYVTLLDSWDPLVGNQASGGSPGDEEFEDE